ncbi:MAG: hypothetical protein ABDH21_04845 [bacterium]
MPVLFLVFKRPDTTKQVFEMIRQARPPRLYIGADGPRDWVEGEKQKVQAVREYIMSNIDWDCQVKTLFREKNLGCGKAVSEAITWFFENEEMGIILEDDTVPSLSFFWFCEELLNKYRDNHQIWHIAGYSIQTDLIEYSYRFSRLVPIWGWASWRRAWKHYDYSMSKFDKNEKDIYEYFGRYKPDVLKTFEEVRDTWDIQWAFTCVYNRAITIIPKRSLVKNIGFGKESTHTKKADSINASINSNDIEFPLIHPPEVIPDQRLDEDYLSKFYRKSLIGIIKTFVRRIIYGR